MEDQGKVTEEAKVTVQTDSESETEAESAEAEALSHSLNVSDETEEVGDPVGPSYLARINVWNIAEERLGRLVRSVTVHFHAHPAGDYATLHASPAEGPDTHQEFNLGRL